MWHIFLECKAETDAGVQLPHAYYFTGAKYVLVAYLTYPTNGTDGSAVYIKGQTSVGVKLKGIRAPATCMQCVLCNASHGGCWEKLPTSASHHRSPLTGHHSPPWSQLVGVSSLPTGSGEHSPSCGDRDPGTVRGCSTARGFVMMRRAAKATSSV